MDSANRIRTNYKAQLDKNPKLKDRLDEIEKVSDPQQKAKQAEDFEKVIKKHNKRVKEAASFEILDNGKIIYYGRLKPAKNEGPASGGRLVKEVDTNGEVRSWFETIDKQTGKPLQVREEIEIDGVKVKRHYLKNSQTGVETGTWDSTYDEKTKQWNKVEGDKQ